MKTLFKKLFKLGIYADDTKGSVVVELALIMSVFALMMVGGYDFSRMAMESHKMEQVARAGTQWAFLGQANAVFGGDDSAHLDPGVEKRIEKLSALVVVSLEDTQVYVAVAGMAGADHQ